MQNYGNVRAWEFPENYNYPQLIFMNVDIQDIMFTPIMFSLFYCGMWLFHKIKDIISNEFFGLFLLFFMFIEIYMVFTGGFACLGLVLGYTIFPLLVLLVTGFKFSQVNKTATIISFLFCLIVGSGWDFIGVVLNNWSYNTDCYLFGVRGWIDERWHISTMFQFALSGFIIMFFNWHFFRDRYYRHIVRKYIYAELAAEFSIKTDEM